MQNCHLEAHSCWADSRIMPLPASSAQPAFPHALQLCPACPAIQSAPISTLLRYPDVIAIYRAGPQRCHVGCRCGCRSLPGRSGRSPKGWQPGTGGSLWTAWTVPTGSTSPSSSCSRSPCSASRPPCMRPTSAGNLQGTSHKIIMRRAWSHEMSDALFKGMQEDRCSACADGSACCASCKPVVLTRHTLSVPRAETGFGLQPAAP